MPDPVAGPLLLQLILIAVNAVFASAEMALVSINDAKLAKLVAAGDKRAIKLSKLTSQPSRFLATIQVAITLSGYLGSAYAAENFAGRLVDGLTAMGIGLPANVLRSISVLLITLILSYITLVFGELVPKRVAMRKAEQLSLALGGFLSAIATVASPLVWLLTVSTNGVLRLFGIDPHAEEEHVTEEEIRMMVDAGSEKGTINENEKQMIQNVFEFDNKTAGEVMTHRTDVTVLWLDESDEQWQRTIIDSRHSVYPICGESTDDIVGLLHTRDYFRLQDRSRESVMHHAVRPAVFVPETVRTDLLFSNMKKRRNHFAVVLDDYGGLSGIITINDLLEQLVGDLEDDETVPIEPPMIERIDDTHFRINGAAPLGKVSEQVGILLPEDDYETFGGFVFGLLGTVPDDGEQPELTEYGLHIKVTRIWEHRLETAVVCIAQSCTDEKAEKVKES